MWKPPATRDFYWRNQISFGEAFRAVLGCSEQCTERQWEVRNPERFGQ